MFRPDSVIDFDIGTEIHFRQCSGDPVIFVEGSESDSSDSDSVILLNVPNGFDAQTAVEGAVVTVKKVADGEWDLFGLLAQTSI